MPASLALKSLDALPRTPASDLKKLGWRGVMKAVAKSGKVLVTNHDEPEAVIIPAAEYDAMLALLREAAEKDRLLVDQLRRKYDERLRWLEAPDAGDILDGLFDKPTDLGGKIFTGAEF